MKEMMIYLAVAAVCAAGLLFLVWLLAPFLASLQ